MAMRDITELMNPYRECSRNLWNVYFSKQTDFGSASDAFEQIRALLFDSLVVGELSYAGDAEGDDVPPPFLRVVPDARGTILVKRLSDPGSGNYWDQEKDLVVGPEDIKLEFLDYLSFSTTPFVDYNFYRCRVLSFPSRAEFEGREALIRTEEARVYHDEDDESDLGRTA